MLKLFEVFPNPTFLQGYPGNPVQGMFCLMSAVDCEDHIQEFNGLPIEANDRPRSVHPVIGALCRSLNDWHHDSSCLPDLFRELAPVVRNTVNNRYITKRCVDLIRTLYRNKIPESARENVWLKYVYADVLNYPNHKLTGDDLGDAVDTMMSKVCLECPSVEHTNALKQTILNLINGGQYE
jgi:hypothetical protein